MGLSKALKGKQFQSWVVLERDRAHERKRQAVTYGFWKCRCVDCGKEKTINGYSLQKGTSNCRCHTVSDHTGQRFGQLVVQGREIKAGEKQAHWRCLCDCGETTLVAGSSLRAGLVKSCGCAMAGEALQTAKDLVGQKKDRVTVLRAEKVRTGSSRFRAELVCQCECGKEFNTPPRQIKRSKTLACSDCLSADKQQSKIDATWNDRYNHYRRRHNKKHQDKQFISFDRFKDLMTANCYYCGKTASMVYRGKTDRNRYPILTGTVDRLDSSKGYEEGNVAPACNQCNIAKRDMPLGVFKNHIKRIFFHLVIQQETKEATK